MNAEIIAVGTELLLGQIVDTNSAHLATVLAECGINCYHRQVVGDNHERLVAALQLALSRSDIVITIGGLGPTQDDMTREAVASVIGSNLVVDPEIESHLRALFATRKLRWIDSQLRQALKPTGATILNNPNGTAPGLNCSFEGQSIICLPGPRGEFIPMVNGSVRQFLERQSGRTIVSKVLRIIGMGEAAVEEKLMDIIQKDDPTVAPYAKVGEMHLRITTAAVSREHALQKLEPTIAEIYARLKNYVYSEDNTSLEESVLALILNRNESLAVAESCTGGLLSKRLTDVPGASKVFLGGVVSYSNSLKQQFLGVPAETLNDFGAVSEECASEMAHGVRAETGADYALSITGIAGPEGGTPDKPVGLVFVAFCSAKETAVRELRLRGTREDIRTRSATSALELLREKLLP